MYCAQLYNSVWLDVGGLISPCCFYKPQVPAGTQTIQVYRSGFESTRQTLENGQWPSQCQYCEMSEQHSGRSSRTEYNERASNWNAEERVESIHTLGLFLGNKCNLHCAICDSKYSSGWVKPAKVFNMVQMPVVSFDFARLDSLIPALDNLKELYITGGESTYMPEMNMLIDYLSDRIDLSECRFHLATNGTLTPTDEQLERWARFKSREITISADGFGKMFEYMRHPGKWEDVAKNIAFYKKSELNINLLSNCVISPMNVYDLDKIAAWGIKEFGMNMQFLGGQKNMWELWNIPDPLKSVIVDKYQHANYAKKLMSQVQGPVQDPTAWPNFRQFINKYDQHWGLSFESTFPEWSAVIKEHNLW